MMIADIVLIIFLLINTILDAIVYRRTRERQQYLMEELWKFEAYIKEWVREELHNASSN